MVTGEGTYGTKVGRPPKSKEKEKEKKKKAVKDFWFKKKKK